MDHRPAEDSFYLPVPWSLATLSWSFTLPGTLPKALVASTTARCFPSLSPSWCSWRFSSDLIFLSSMARNSHFGRILLAHLQALAA